MSEHDERGAQTQGPQASPFDAIRREDAEGNEWWSARELATILDYPRWQKFRPVIDRAIEACEKVAMRLRTILPVRVKWSPSALERSVK